MVVFALVFGKSIERTVKADNKTSIGGAEHTCLDMIILAIDTGTSV